MGRGWHIWVIGRHQESLSAALELLRLPSLSVGGWSWRSVWNSGLRLVLYSNACWNPGPHSLTADPLGLGFSPITGAESDPTHLLQGFVK